MRVLILGQYPIDPEIIKGGVETSIIGLVNELIKFPDIELYIITTNIMRRDVTKIINNVTIHYVASPPLPRFITMSTIDKYRIIKKIKKINPDIIHAHMSNYGYYALKSGFPMIITIHGIAKEEYDPRLRPGLLDIFRRSIILPMEKYVIENAKVLTVVSPYVKRKLQTCCTADIQIIPNGVRNEFFNIENKEVDNRLLFIGGIEPRKGLFNMLDAIKILSKQIPSIKFHIVGRIRKLEYYNSLVEHIMKNELNRYIIFKGELSEDDIKKELAEASVFVFPSKEESFGIVLAEAGACGKPVVTSNTGGIPFVVDNNKTGYLVEYNDVDILAEKILVLLKNKNLRIEMGNAGKEKAREFSNKDIAKRFYKLYMDIIENG